MDASTFIALAAVCAPAVHPGTAQALVDVESGFNPHAIGVVGAALSRQPSHKPEALATARALQAQGWNFSLGLAQINVRNLQRLGLSLDTALEPCPNLGAMQVVLAECFGRAELSATGRASPQSSLRQALSCYYSGNFVTGFEHGYVRRVVAAAARAHRRSNLPQEAP